MIDIIVSDDHDLVRAGIVRMLDDIDSYQVVGEATSGEDTIALCEKIVPDIILMDVRMPGIGGLEATRIISRRWPQIKVIGVSVMEEDPFPKQFLKVGAHGYVSKNSSIDEIIDAIEQVMQGKRYMSSVVAQHIALNPYKTSSADDSPFSSLSNRELQICMMVVNCHKVQAISSSLNLSSKTVNTYRYRIFEKLNVSGDVELTRLAIRHGLLDIDSD